MKKFEKIARRVNELENHLNKYKNNSLGISSIIFSEDDGSLVDEKYSKVESRGVELKKGGKLFTDLFVEHLHYLDVSHYSDNITRVMLEVDDVYFYIFLDTDEYEDINFHAEIEEDHESFYW